MSEQSKTITNWLFWGAFAVFLGVSIPHIAWVVRQYTPQNGQWYTNFFYSVLSLGYAVAIDGIMAWLTHAQSQTRLRISKQAVFTWVFIVILVAMSWYLNWLYNVAHDPSKQLGTVWNFELFGLWGSPAITVGAFTPVLLGALPVFTIAYVGVLNNVNHMKTQAAKSLEELEDEAKDIEKRRALEDRIKNAGKKKSEEDITDKAFSQVSKFGKKFKQTREELIGERKEKLDKQTIMLNKILDFYRDTPHLLIDTEHLNSTDLMIKNLLKLKKTDMAIPWRIKAAQVLQKESTEEDNRVSLSGDEKDQSSDDQQTQENTIIDESSSTEQDNGETQENDLTSTERNTDKLNRVPRNGDEKGTENTNQYSALDGLSGRSTMSVEDTAKLIGCEVKYVRQLRNKGKLKASGKNDELLTVASIKGYLQARKKVNHQTQQSAETEQSQVI